MSELDQDQAGATADEAHDNPGTLDDEIDLTPAPTKPEILKTMMRSFLKMFSMYTKTYLCAVDFAAGSLCSTVAIFGKFCP